MTTIDNNISLEKDNNNQSKKEQKTQVVSQGLPSLGWRNHCGNDGVVPDSEELHHLSV